MKTNWRWLVGIVGLTVLSSVTVCRADGPYRFLKEIPVGGEGGWDDLSVDAAARRLYVTHATSVVVIDLETDKVVGEIADTPGVHGFAVAPELGRGFSSNGRENKVSIVDLKTLKTLSKMDTGENPDAIVYEPGHQEVYAFNGRGNSATVIDAKTGKLVTTVMLTGKPEFAAVDSKADRVYCNLEDKSAVVAIDATTHQVVNTWPIAPGVEPSGIAIDLAHHRLFSGCHNKLMVMTDNTNGKVIATVPIGDRVDGGAFDPAAQLAFSSCGDGTVTIAHEDTPDKLTVAQTLATERGARTMTLDPKTHKIYLPCAKFEPMPPAEPGARRQRPKIITNTFKILVYGQ
ncbi:MAG TPA: YncE family protein [Verrucomicrobiae bacterium]|nr:YncE family protein [Verrucomicrobiae bacterium]